MFLNFFVDKEKNIYYHSFDRTVGQGVKMAALIVDKEKKREHILLSAINVFASKGFSKTTINDIAKSAGIGKGTIYEYFKSKDEIIHSAFVYFTNSMMRGFDEIISSDMNAKDKLIGLLRSFCVITNGKSGDLLDIMMDFWADSIRNDNAKGILQEDMKDMYISYRELITGIIQTGMKEGSFKKNIDPFFLATSIVGMLDGITVQWMLDKKKINISKTIVAIIEMVLKGVEVDRQVGK